MVEIPALAFKHGDRGFEVSDLSLCRDVHNFRRPKLG
jgi:hypothetical protein